MPPKNKTLSIWPDEIDRLIVGGNGPACNLAIACWARVLQRSMPELAREEWNFLADVLNAGFEGNYALSNYEHGAQAVALEVHDAQRLNGTGDKWFGEEPGSGQAMADALERKVSAMGYEEIQYVRSATNFFWSDAGLAAIDHQRDEWWSIEFRVRCLRAAALASRSSPARHPAPSAFSPPRAAST